ncbi:MAG: hypothetical protein M3325_18735 [Actinomycetota bacterium]|nr:hypothetical protein [Actinomycetota bacterium]
MNPLHPTPAPTQIRLPTLPAAFPTTRDTIHRVAAHILGRRRYALSGKFGLRATPGGIGTPAFGPDYEVVRITATVLVCERTGATARTTSLDLRTATLLHAATLVDVDLSQGFAVGQDTPSLGNPSTPLEIDAAAAHALAEWFRYGWAVLDAVLAAVSPHTKPTVIQLWPEHFDAAFDLAVTPECRTNLGVSPGDNYCPQPYLYVGPWDGKRPSGSNYWNAPFGAVINYDELRTSEHAVTAGVAFLQRGIDLLTS